MRSEPDMSLRHADSAGEASAHGATAIEIEASVIGGGLGIEPSQVQAQLREGKISTLCERGVGEDQGRYRVTFYCGKRRFRVLIDEFGNIIEASERM
jgi:hypothetical protein